MDAHLIDTIRGPADGVVGSLDGCLPCSKTACNGVFVADAPDRLWVTDITQHRIGEGWIYCAAVIDVFSRRCVGWSIAGHLRTELVVDAIDMARWRRKPSGRWSTPIAEPSSPPGCSAPGFEKPT